MLGFKSWLNEGFTFAGKNYKDPLIALKDIYNDATKTGAQDMLVCHFGLVNKMGINPTVEFDTPRAIYFYTLKNVIDNGLSINFPTEYNYIHVCRLNPLSNILDMYPAEISGRIPSEYDSDDKIDEYVEKIVKTQGGFIYLKQIPNYMGYIKDVLYSGLHMRSNLSLLWLVTRQAANKNPVKWTSILRNLGIDGFIDHGTGTIHTNEPEQCVVFDARSFKHILTIEANEKHKANAQWRADKEIPEVDEEYMAEAMYTLSQLEPSDEIYNKNLDITLFRNKIGQLSNIVGYYATANKPTKQKLIQEIRSFNSRIHNKVIGREVHPKYRELYRWFFNIVKDMASRKAVHTFHYKFMKDISKYENDLYNDNE